MKRFLLVVFLALILSFDGFAQTPSVFPKLDPAKATGVNIAICESGLVSITSYSIDDVTVFAFENDNGVLFGISQFIKNKFVGVFVLQPDKSVVFYTENEKYPKPCEVADSLPKTDKQNKF
jgi:hypothetical protein